MQKQFWVIFLVQLAPQIPSLILMILGIIASLYLRRLNPNKFLLSAISFSIFSLLSLANPFFHTWLAMQFDKGNFSTTTQIGFSSFLFGVASQSLWFTAWIILFILIFNKKYNKIENHLG